MKAINLKTNVSWILLGNLLYSFCQWAWLIVLSKIGGAHTVGEFSLVMAIVVPVFMLSSLQLRSLISTNNEADYQKKDFINLRLILSSIAFLLLFVYSFWFKYGDLLIAFSFAKFVESLIDVFHGYLQRQHRMKNIAISMIFKGVGSLLFLTIVFFISNNLVLGIWSIGIAWIGLLFIYVLPVALKFVLHIPSQSLFNHQFFFVRNFFVGFRNKRQKELFLMSLPLGLALALVSLNANIPRYLIEYFLSTELLGVYAAMAYVTIAGRMIDLALNQAISPRLADYFKMQEKGKFKKLLLRYHLVGLFLGCMGVLLVSLFGARILRLIYSEEFARFPEVFIYIMVGTAIIWSFSFLNSSMIVFRLLKHQLYFTLFSTIAVFISGYILIPLFGLKGAALSQIIAALVPIPFKLYLVRRKLNSFFPN